MRCDDGPALVVHEHLVDAHLMLFSSARKTGMEDQIVFAGIFIIISGIVSGRDIAFARHIRLTICWLELKIAHQLHTVRRIGRIIKQHARGPLRVDHILSLGIGKRTVRRFRAGNTDIVTPVRRQSSKRQKQVVIVRLRAVQHVRAFNAGMVASEHFFAITLALQRFSRLGIKLQHKDSAGIRAIDHPQLSVLIEKNIRVHHIRLLIRVIHRSVIGNPVHARFENNAFVLVRAFNVVRNGYAHSRQRGVSPAGVIVHIEFAVRQLNNIRRPQRVRLRPTQRLGQLCRHIWNKRIAVRHTIRNLHPGHQILRLGRSKMGAEYVIHILDLDDGRIMYGNVSEDRSCPRPFAPSFIGLLRR
ncbi:hypothetical protein D3C71_1173370 [compost metagenome]